MNEGVHLIIPMKCCTLLVDGPLVHVFANEMAVLFVDDYVLLASLLVRLIWLGTSGCVLPRNMALGILICVLMNVSLSQYQHHVVRTNPTSVNVSPTLDKIVLHEVEKSPFCHVTMRRIYNSVPLRGDWI